MTQGGTGSQNLEEADVLAMTSLASRGDLPARVRQLLGGVFGLFWRNLERSLATTLDEFERHLIQQANKPRVGEAGGRCLESIRRIKPTRADLAPRLMLALEDDLARFDQRSGNPVARKIEPVAAPWQELSLVGSHELDESLTLREMASRVEIRHSVPLFELGYRFGVLAARPAFDLESLPFGPGRICAALRYAVAVLDLPLDHRVMFYQTFDRCAMSGVGALYTAANTYFAEQRVLKYLQLQTLQKNRAPAPPPADAKAPAAPRETAPPRPRGGDPTDVDVGGFGLAAFEMASTARAKATAPSAPARETRPQQTVADTPDAQRFGLLREQLGAYRRNEGIATAPAPDDAFEPAPRDLQAALGVLQVRSPPTIMLGGKVVQRTVAQLRQDLLNQLRQATPSGQTPHLADEDADTIDLVGLLFEQLMAATRPDSRTQSMLTRLQVPVLRAALRDRRFFFNPEHPARRLLASVVDTGSRWLDDGAESDPLLTERLQRAIERINSEFDTDMRVFDQVNEELQTFVGAMARRAEVAERRLVEACRGREKLALARDTAARAITIRLAAKQPPRLLRTLLEQAWIDVLALTVLRQGEKSDTYRRQLALADQLIAVGDTMHSMRDHPLAAGWREEIESGLTQVGYHAEEVQAVVARLFGTGQGDKDDEALTQTDLAMRLKSKMRLGEAAGDDIPPGGIATRPGSSPLSPQEAQTLEQVKAMPFGTWFEVAGAKGSDHGRLKLSWFSSLTGRCLLTGQRGARIDERGLEQLARDLAGGRLRVEPQGHESIADRCWRSSLEQLERAAASGRGGNLPLH
jgi:Protein of unknown function (DUF1631)